MILSFEQFQMIVYMITLMLTMLGKMKESEFLEEMKLKYKYMKKVFTLLWEYILLNLLIVMN